MCMSEDVWKRGVKCQLEEDGSSFTHMYNVYNIIQHLPEMRLNFNFSSQLMFHMIFLQLGFEQNLKIKGSKLKRLPCHYASNPDIVDWTHEYS